MQPGDVGCHVALLCAQSFEKCIKGSMLLVGQTPMLTHEVEICIDSMLREADKRKDPLARLRGFYKARDARRFAEKLLAWTPGKARAGDPNYEYPWRKDPTATLEVPYGHPLFERAGDHQKWIKTTQALSDNVAKIAEAILRDG